MSVSSGGRASQTEGGAQPCPSSQAGSDEGSSSQSGTASGCDIIISYNINHITVCACVCTCLRAVTLLLCVPENSDLLSLLSERLEEKKKELQSQEQVATFSLTHTHTHINSLKLDELKCVFYRS